MVLRLSEIYASTQGEGPNTGLPTTFVRFAGCNLRCPGWPCDTQHAIDPKYYKDWTKHSVLELASLVPDYPQNICLTGGEPFLQDQQELEMFVEALQDIGHTVEIFTNMTRPIPRWFFINTTLMMDWKLKGSGEGDRDIDCRMDNLSRTSVLSYCMQGDQAKKHGVKFVVKNQSDLDEAFQWWNYLYTKQHLWVQFWVGACWGETTDEQIVAFILQHELPWRLNVQVHKHIWHPEARRV